MYLKLVSLFYLQNQRYLRCFAQSMTKHTVYYLQLHNFKYTKFLIRLARSQGNQKFLGFSFIEVQVKPQIVFYLTNILQI